MKKLPSLTTMVRDVLGLVRAFANEAQKLQESPKGLGRLLKRNAKAMKKAGKALICEGKKAEKVAKKAAKKAGKEEPAAE